MTIISNTFTMIVKVRVRALDELTVRHGGEEITVKGDRKEIVKAFVGDTLRVKLEVRDEYNVFDELEKQDFKLLEILEVMNRFDKWNDGESDSDWDRRVNHGEYDPVTDTVSFS